MADFTYDRAESSEDVDAFLRDHEGEGWLLAGGTDLLVRMRSGDVRPRHVLDLNFVPALRELHVRDGRLRVGAAVRLTAIVEHEGVRRRCRALVDGAGTVGSVQIQNMGTLIGNVCNASPAADTAPALLAHDAVVNVRGHLGAREVPAEEFFRGPGVTALAPQEWVQSIDIAPARDAQSSYVKLGRTRGVDIAIVGAAVAVGDSQVTVALASVAPTPVRSRRAEEALSVPPDEIDWRAVEQALGEDIAPLTDIRASADYRSAMACECVRRAFANATEAAERQA
jgi:carbon-monoxide dehydrogenase medium subunit